MIDLPFWIQVVALVVILLISAFFSIAETSMMAVNRYRLRHLAASGSRLAKRTQALLGKTDRLLGVILMGNNIANALATTLVTALTIRYFARSESALLIATGAISFVIIVFSELTPKVIGATFPERIALPASVVLTPLLRLLAPLVWFVNLFVGALLTVMRIKRVGEVERRGMTPEELRSVVTESTPFFPSHHRRILLNLFDLNAIVVDDVMTPRGQVEALDLEAPLEELTRQLATCYHNKLPVYEGELNRVRGLLHVRKVLGLLERGELSKPGLIDLLNDAYFVPSGTPVFEQLKNFQDNRQRSALVVDEYGEVQGLVTLEDIIEEIIGEFTTNVPGASRGGPRWDSQGQVLVEGRAGLRELNRNLDIRLPTDGPKTLNGLVLEYLEEIPEAPVSIRIDDVVIEVVQIEDRSIKMARLSRIAR